VNVRAPKWVQTLAACFFGFLLAKNMWVQIEDRRQPAQKVEGAVQDSYYAPPGFFGTRLMYRVRYHVIINGADYYWPRQDAEPLCVGTRLRATASVVTHTLQDVVVLSSPPGCTSG
jgi:hypothetical protein